jgi:hypothetical protein
VRGAGGRGKVATKVGAEKTSVVEAELLKAEAAQTVGPEAEAAAERREWSAAKPRRWWERDRSRFLTFDLCPCFDESRTQNIFLD